MPSCSPNKVGPKIWWFLVSYSVGTFRRILIVLPHVVITLQLHHLHPLIERFCGGRRAELHPFGAGTLALRHCHGAAAADGRSRVAGDAPTGQGAKGMGDEEVLGIFSLERGRGGRKWMGFFLLSFVYIYIYAVFDVF